MPADASLAFAAFLMLLLQPATAQRAGSGSGGYREAPTVLVRQQGAVSGLDVPLNKIGHRAWTYLGIPYAKPPTGDLRFAPPDVDPPPAWDGVRNGSAHMPACIQYPPARQHPVHRLFATVAAVAGTVPAAAPLKTSEDCLYLNVYRPEGKPRRRSARRERDSPKRRRNHRLVRYTDCSKHDGQVTHSIVKTPRV